MVRRGRPRVVARYRLRPLPSHIVESAVKSVVAKLEASTELRHLRQQLARAAQAVGEDWWNVPEQTYKDAILVAEAKSEAEALECLRASLPKPEGHKTVFDFDGTAAELEAHNRMARERAAAKRRPLNVPVVSRLGGARPRERRPSCATRVRGSRRGALRSASRGGDSGDDGPGESEEPELGPREQTNPAVAP